MQKILILFLSLLIFNSLIADEKYFDLSLQKNKLNSDWPLLPNLPDSFKKFDSDIYQIKFKQNKYRFSYLTESFYGSGVRETYPRVISSGINSERAGIGLDLTPKINFQLFLGRSSTDPELFDCYQKGSLIIGGCVDSDFEISSTLDKYDRLNGDVLYIEGNSQSTSFVLNFSDFYWYLDNLKLSWITKKTKFDWLTPVEDISSPVILNSIINGVRVGSIIDELLINLPQRETWKTNVFSLGIKKKYSFQEFDFYVEQDLFVGNRINFYKFKDKNKINYKLVLGIAKKIGSLEFKFEGNLYTNFLLWNKEELYNYKSEEYFGKKFGSLGLEVNYRHTM